MFLRMFLTSPITFLTSIFISLSLSLTLCLVTEKCKEKKMIFLFDGSFVAKKMKGKRRKKWFLNFFLEVDNFNLFSFFLWWFVWLPSKTEGMEGKKEMKGILWLSSGAIRWYCLRVCLVAENKTEKKKSHFFFSLSKALFGCWEMNFMTFVAEKMKGKNRKSDF